LRTDRNNAPVEHGRLRRRDDVRRLAPLRHRAGFGCGSGRGNRASGADRAELVSLLSRAGLLRATRGSGGGLKLARPAAAISLADIVEAVEGPIALTPCVEHGRHDCALEACCSVRPHWGVVNETLRGALAGVPLTRLAQPEVVA